MYLDIGGMEMMKFSPPLQKASKQTNTKTTVKCSPKKQVICSSDYKTAKIFMKELGFSLHAGLQL